MIAVRKLRALSSRVTPTGTRTTMVARAFVISSILKTGPVTSFISLMHPVMTTTQVTIVTVTIVIVTVTIVTMAVTIVMVTVTMTMITMACQGTTGEVMAGALIVVSVLM